MMCISKNSRGFALPTVLIASIVMLTVIVAAASSVANVRVGLDSQYYLSLANDAAEAGVVYSTSCIKSGSTWGVKNLTPATDCSGNTPTPAQGAYVASTPTYQTSFTVGPVTNTGAGAYLATSTGKIELLRPNGSVWKSFTKSAVMQTGGQIDVNRVVFGYSAGNNGDGVFFGAIGGDGKMRTVGWNAYGQLGNGTTTSSLTPTTFNVPLPIASAYTNFLSGGTNLFAILSDGSAYGAGWNNQWQLGINSNVTPKPTPTKVVFPPGVTAWQSITTGGDRTFLLGNDHNLYATGNCDTGQLGTNYTVSGCYNVHVPTRVNLPAYNASDPNTIPTSQVVTDRASAYVVMQGGALYGWGAGDLGQLGDTMWNNNLTNTSNPVKIGTYGDSGQPKVKQVETDGDTVYVLDTLGKVNSAGLNHYGEMGTNVGSIYFYDGMYYGTKKCVDYHTAGNPTLWLYPCNGTNPQKFYIQPDGTIRSKLDSNYCLDNYGSDGVTIGMWTCNGGANQKFQWQPVAGTWWGYIQNLNSATGSKCLEQVSDNTNLKLNTCNGSIAQKFLFYNSNLDTGLTPLDTSQFSGSVTKIATDQWSMSFMTSAGEVWSVGINKTGQFGNGGTGNAYGYNPLPTKFQLPAGVTATDLYQTSSGINQQNLFVIGSNGKVYGAGSNSHGELGDGTNTNRSSPVAMWVIDGASVVAKAVKSGFGTTVIYTTNGSVYTVGSNTNGQLGDGTTTDSWIPIKAKYTNNLGTSMY